MKVGYYPGCSQHSTAKEFEMSLHATASRIGLELNEIRDWSCCGATSAHATNHLLGVALPARNLALAEAQQHDKLLAPCAACYSRLATAHHELSHDEALAAKVKTVLERPFDNKVAVLNIIEVLRELAPTIKEKAQPVLKDLKVACYYGCLLVRPQAVTGAAEYEAPTSMEEVVAAAGATPVTWNKRLDCCGAGFALSRTGSVIRLGRSIVEDARKAGAEALVVACPMCHANLDLRQGAMKEGPALPVLFLTQVVGLALGVDAKELGLARHFVSTKPVIERVRAAAAAAPREQA
jgi:heterodisulfide reductase subunit B2